MDISMERTKISFRDIILGLKDICLGDNISKDDKKINDRIAAIQRIEAQMGATERINGLEQNMQKYGDSKKRKKGTTPTVVRNQESIIEENNIESLKSENVEDYERDM